MQPTELLHPEERWSSKAYLGNNLRLQESEEGIFSIIYTKHNRIVKDGAHK